MHQRKIGTACRGPSGAHAQQRHSVDAVTVRCLVQDRHRSIRQDLDQQRVRSLFAVRIYEEMVRHILTTLHEYCEGAPLLADEVCVPVCANASARAW
jgi:SAC3/GANP family